MWFCRVSLRTSEMGSRATNQDSSNSCTHAVVHVDNDFFFSILIQHKGSNIYSVNEFVMINWTT